jgi:extracellular solute-binding protein (family 5)
MGRVVVAFGFIVCFQAMSVACSSHITPAGLPAPSQPDRPPEPPSPVPSTPKPPPSAPAATPPGAEAGSTDCALIAEAGEPVATVALSNPINPSNAPHPSNDSERLVFRQLYETLVRTDCHGRARPGLAASWQLDANGRTWIVTLRENARFSDGTPVTAADVRASWTDGTGEELRPPVSGLVQSVVVVGDRALAIVLRSQRADEPLALAHPDLAIAKSVADSQWPLGTRSSRIATEAHPAAATAAAVMTVDRDNLPAIRFFVAAGDARDLLDQGVDLLLTRDPATLEYAATLPQFRSVPLAWQRTRVLLAPGRSRSAASLSEDARNVLADDAVRGEARGARGPFWWQMMTDCEVTLAPPPDHPTPISRIVYDASDGAARDLAERFVGLARASGAAATAFLDALLPDRPRRTYQRAAGLTGEALAQAQRRGTDAGYVTSVDSRPIEPCQELKALMDRAPWLDPETIVPLVDTRLQAVVRRGRSGVTAEWDGGLVIAAVNDPR